MKLCSIIKTIFLFISLSITTHSICQKVTYKSLIGTSWVLFDSVQALTMTFQFIDSSHLSQNSWAPRYQPSMKTIINYSLDTTKKTTLLNVEWKGEVLKCISCKVKIIDSFLVIESLSNGIVDKPLSNTEKLQTKWVFKKVFPSHQ